MGAAIDSSLSANVRVGLETKSVRFNYDNTLASPKTLDYTDAVNGIITSVTAEQMSYLGYSGAVAPRLNILLGNRVMGYQSMTIPLNIRTMTAQATNVTIASDVFNPEWYNKSEYQSMTVSFAGNIKHTMYLDWSTYRLYSDNAYKNELVGDDKNIFAGGTFYATVEAYVLDAEGNEIGNYNGKRQAIKLTLNVAQRSVSDIFFYNGSTDGEGIDDLNNYTVNAMTIDAYDYFTGAANYFEDGVKIKVVYNDKSEGFAYIDSWNVDITNAENGAIVKASIGNNSEYQINVNFKTYVVDRFEFDESTTIKSENGVYTYDMLTAYTLPTSATVYFKDGTSKQLDIRFVTDGAPYKDEFIEKKDLDGTVLYTYVEREVVVYEGIQGLEQTLTIEIKLTNHNLNGDDVEVDFGWGAISFSVNNEAVTSSEASVASETAAPSFSVFKDFSLPSTAKVTYNGNIYDNVPVTWFDKDGNAAQRPDMAKVIAEEIKDENGLDGIYYFTLTASFAGITKDVEFIYYYKYEINVKDNPGFGTYTDQNMGMDFYTYTLGAENFFNGLPNQIVVRVYNSEVRADFEQVTVNATWRDVTYTSSGIENKRQFVMLSAGGFETVQPEQIEIGYLNYSTDMICFLTVEAPSDTINDYIAENFEKMYVFDTLGLYTQDETNTVKKLFENGEKTTVQYKTGVSDGNDTFDEIEVTLSYQLPADIMTSKEYFGKVLNVDVTLNNAQGSIVVPVQVYVIDRTIEKITSVSDRTVVFDPFIGDFSLFSSTYAQTVNQTVTTELVGEQTNFKVSNAGTLNVQYDVVWDETLISKAEQSIGGANWPNNMVDLVYKATEATQQFNIPVSVINRTIEKLRLIMGGDYTLTDTIGYRTVNREIYTSVNDSQIVMFDYDVDTSLPVKIEIKNPYTYNMANFPTNVSVVFTDGQEMVYNITWENIPETVTGNVSDFVKLNAHVATERDITVADFEVELAVRAFNVTRFNSTIASDTLDTDYTYVGYPYATTTGTTIKVNNVEQTVYNPFGLTYENSFRAYLDGTWIKKEYAVNYVGYKTLARDASGNVIETNLADTSLIDSTKTVDPVYYNLNQLTRRYESVGGTDYIYVFTVAFTIDNVTWDKTSIDYNANGGTTYAIATFGGNTNAGEHTYNVPVEIKNSSNYEFDWSESFWSTIAGNEQDVFRAAVGVEGASGYGFDPAANIDYTGSDFAKYYPNKTTMKFLDAEGNVLWTQVMDIEWSFTNLEIDMSGGLGYTKVIINGNNEFNYQDSVTNFTLKQLSITQTVKYMNRTWKLDMSTNSAIKAWTGFAGADQMTASHSNTTNINPYNYSKPTLPESIVMRSTDGNDQKTFTEAGTNGYKLEWDLTEFYPSYMGGQTYVYAVLTTPSGLTQRLRITLYVQKMLISRIDATNVNFDRTVDIETGIAEGDPFTIKPFEASTYSLPSAYTVTFTTSSYNGTSFTQVSTTQTMTINYAPVTMPSDFEYAFNSNATTYLASIKFGSQQRVYVNVTLAAFTDSVSTGSVYGGNNSTNAYVNTMYGGRPVAFIGYAYVESGKVYKVEISSLETNYYLPKFKGNRAVTYVLVPIFGVMVDNNGTVLTKTTITQAEINTYGLGSVYSEGDTIPYGKGGFGTKFTIVSKN